MRAEASVVRGVRAMRSDRLAGIDDAVAPGMERHDRLHPFVVAAAANLATFAAAYRHDVAEVELTPAWAEPYFAESSWDGIGAVVGLCYRGAWRTG